MVSALPGALALRGRGEAPAARATIHELEEGRLRTLACVVPADSQRLAGPDLRAGTRGRRASPSRIGLDRHLRARERPRRSGPAAGVAVAALLAARGVLLITSTVPIAFQGGKLRLEGGRSLEADRVIALPRLTGPAIRGLPADDDGFLPIDHHGRVRGVEGVYAAGDATNFPIKQGRSPPLRPTRLRG